MRYLANVSNATCHSDALVIDGLEYYQRGDADVLTPSLELPFCFLTGCLNRYFCWALISLVDLQGVLNMYIYIYVYKLRWHCRWSGVSQ